MAAPKKATHVMVHPRQYMRVNGKLQRVDKGTEIALSEEQAAKFGKKVMKLGQKKAVDVTGDPAE